MSVLSLKDSIKDPQLKRSRFDLSHFHATTGKIGYLEPVYCEEVVPGDTFKIKVNHLLRFLPLAGPLTQRLDMYVHAFYVPNRIVWSDWEGFITGRNATNVPTEDLYLKKIDQHCIGDRYGIPQRESFTGHHSVSRLPLLGYVKIYNDYYRNTVVQNEVDPATINYSSKIFIRNWRKDYFTSAVPFPQLGDPAKVTMDVNYLTQALGTRTGSIIGGGMKINSSGQIQDAGSQGIAIENIDDISVNVNELRYAYALQDWLTRMYKSGDHYGDQLKNIFGVNSSDGRLQMVEYIGGYSAPVIINDITQVGGNEYESDGTTIKNPLGTQGGQAVTFGASDDIECFCEEHGYIHIIVSVMPKSIHYGGLARHFSKTLPLDFYFPQFSYLPEQAIYNKEIFLATSNEDQNVFGYIERYGEYKHRQDQISGEMARNFDHMHMANIYTTHQNLNDTFLKCIPREDAFAVTGDIHYFGQFGFQVDADRPMPFNVDGMSIYG